MSAGRLPRSVDDWVFKGEDLSFDRKSVFRYLNGGGELYLAYGFRKLLVREYAGTSAPPIVAEIYGMSSSEDAYGVFSHDPDGEEIEIGQEGLYGMGLLRFWKNHAFVRVMAAQETKDSRAAVLALGCRIARTIPGTGKKPALLGALPGKGLLDPIPPYFHNPFSLDLHYYLADSNLLHLSEETEAVLGRYREKEGKATLLLCRYRGAEEATQAFTSFYRTYLAVEPAPGERPGISRIERKEYVGVRRLDNVLILVFEAKSRSTCERLVLAAGKRVEEVYR